jgi:hypothetical protein
MVNVAVGVENGAVRGGVGNGVGDGGSGAAVPTGLMVLAFASMHFFVRQLASAEQLEMARKQ